MVYFIQGEINNMLITKSFYCKGNDLFTTIKLVNKSTNVVTIISPSDISLSPYYYQFKVGLTNDPIVYDDNVNIALDNGQYSYEIHSMLSQFDLDINNSQGILEYGMIEVNGDVIGNTEIDINEYNTNINISEYQSNIKIN